MAIAFQIGRRVILRPAEETDAEVLAEYINHPETRRFIMVRFPKSLREEREWIASLSTKGTPQNLVFVVERKRDGQAIGVVGLHQIDWVQRRCVSGSFIGPPRLRGEGYGTEAKSLLLDYAFGELGMQSVWALVFADNTPSIRALEKQGYRRGGVHRKSVWRGSTWIDSYYYDILQEDWAALRRKPRARSKGRR